MLQQVLEVISHRCPLFPVFIAFMTSTATIQLTMGRKSITTKTVWWHIKTGCGRLKASKKAEWDRMMGIAERNKKWNMEKLLPSSEQPAIVDKRQNISLLTCHRPKVGGKYMLICLQSMWGEQRSMSEGPRKHKSLISVELIQRWTLESQQAARYDVKPFRPL